MKPMGDDLKKRLSSIRAVAKPGSERGELLTYFIDTLNPARKDSGYRPITFPRMGFLVSHIPTGDLYALKSKMEDAKRRNFPPSIVFHMELKVIHTLEQNSQ